MDTSPPVVDESRPANATALKKVLQSHGFDNIQVVRTTWHGKSRIKVMGDRRFGDEFCSLQAYAGAAGEHQAFYPQLLLGRGDFPNVTRVPDLKDGGCMINGGRAAWIVERACQFMEWRHQLRIEKRQAALRDQAALRGTLQGGIVGAARA